MEYLVSRGAPRDKLLVGIPFYGQSFSLLRNDKYDQGVPTRGPGEPGEYTKQPGMLAYYEICNKIRNQRWPKVRDSYIATGPYAYSRDQWVGFEDVDSINEKVYIQNNNEEITIINCDINVYIRLDTFNRLVSVVPLLGLLILMILQIVVVKVLIRY